MKKRKRFSPKEQALDDYIHRAAFPERYTEEGSYYRIIEAINKAYAQPLTENLFKTSPLLEYLKNGARATTVEWSSK